MTYSFHPAAVAELRRAMRRYEREQAGLGRLFLDEMHARVLDVLAAPESFVEIAPGVRRAAARGRFPHVLVFRTYGDEVRFFAVMHPRRRPGYWARRVL